MGFVDCFTGVILTTTANVPKFKMEQRYIKGFLFFQEIEILFVLLGSSNDANIRKGESEIVYTAGYCIGYLQMQS